MLRYYSIIFSFFLTCLLTFSCSKEERTLSPPENLIKEEKMVDLLVATHILEHQLAEAKLAKNAKEDSFKVYQEEIFVAKGIDSAAFFSSYEYYTNQVDQFHQLMVRVTDSLSYLRDHANDNPANKKEDQQNDEIEADSIKKLD